MTRDHPDQALQPGKVIPHPLDRARLAQQEQQRRFAEVQAALDADDFHRVRSLLAEHDVGASDNDPWADRREGYQLIADCKQYPSAQARAAGQRFIKEQHGSTLRRAVRRTCLNER